MTHEAHENARVHIMGCMALFKATLPTRTVPAMGVRGVLQLSYSLVSKQSTLNVSKLIHKLMPLTAHPLSEQ